MSVSEPVSFSAENEKYSFGRSLAYSMQRSLYLGPGLISCNTICRYNKIVNIQKNWIPNTCVRPPMFKFVIATLSLSTGIHFCTI